MTTTSGVQRAPIGDAGFAYEELRSHVLTDVPGNGAGLVLLLREGLAAWIEGRGAFSPASEPGARPSPERHVAAPALSDEVHAGIVGVLASMVLAG